MALLLLNDFQEKISNPQQSSCCFCKQCTVLKQDKQLHIILAAMQVMVAQNAADD